MPSAAWMRAVDMIRAQHFLSAFDDESRDDLAAWIVDAVLKVACPAIEVVEAGDELARMLARAPGIDPMRSVLLQRWHDAAHPEER